MEADNQSKEVEIGGRGNSRSIDDVRYEEEPEPPNITRVDCLETDPYRSTMQRLQIDGLNV